MTAPNGVVATHGYDRADRLLSITNVRDGTTVSLATPTPTTRTATASARWRLNGGTPETTTYTYDDLNRLKTVTYPADATFPAGRVVTYGYDAVGNRAARDHAQARRDAPCGEAGRL